MEVQILQIDAVLLRIHGNHGRSDKKRDIVPRFTRKVGTDVPEVPLGISTPSLGPSHTASTAIVGRQGEVPVTKVFVQVPQKPHRGTGRLFNVATLVDPRIDSKAILPTGRGNELPHAYGLGP